MKIRGGLMTKWITRDSSPASMPTGVVKVAGRGPGIVEKFHTDPDQVKDSIKFTNS